MAKVLIATRSGIEKKATLKSITDQLPEAFWPVDTMRNDKDVFSSALGHLMCKRLLLEEVKEEALQSLRPSLYGKWKLPGFSLDFNIAHSGDYVVVVLTNPGVAGIDIEVIRPIPWRDYEDCFSAPEWETLSRSPQPEEKFFELWTRKESLAKAYGMGLQFPLNKIHVSDRSGILHDSIMRGYFYSLPIPGYSACVCLSEQQDIVIEHFV